ncbi:hypothetical protein C2G38_2196321 [Gigaspora rosea]|uniref:Uncharacterized protein n=1 Tax=Gigaspora rosea TaxID=44941 RepID=A0A397UUR2_9GLOM|nr:hypothetical protein C2G38_2196321 [Gigaspora rosea]
MTYPYEELNPFDIEIDWVTPMAEKLQATPSTKKPETNNNSDKRDSKLVDTSGERIPDAVQVMKERRNERYQ